jgi:type IV pilus assembly protein PilW
MKRDVMHLPSKCHHAARRRFAGRQDGFTLVEVLIVVAISIIVLAGIYSVFQAQQRAHLTNSQVVEMQQNMRAALFLMEREIRMAGYSPTMNADAGFDAARSGELSITMDLNDDGLTTGANEDVSYGFSTAVDADRDGDVDAGGAAAFGRNTGGGYQPVAENIERIGFAYAFDDDNDGELDTSGGSVIWAYDADGDGELDTNTDTGAALASTVELNRIRAVRIWILARSSRGISDYTDTRTYSVGDLPAYAPNDNFVRRLVTTTVKCRNMGA